MFTLFKHKSKRGSLKKFDVTPSSTPVPHADQVKADNETLRKSIATKLERYRPLEKEADFTGPR